MADGAVRVGQSIRMKVRLLDRGAEEKKDGAEDGKHEARARFRCRMLIHSSHYYRYYTLIRFQATPSKIGLIRRGYAQNEGERKLLWRLLRTGPRLGLSNLVAPQRTRGYRQGVDRNVAAQACVIAWLLCAILTCLNVHSPHCDFCDGPSVVRSSSQHSVHQPMPAAPDTCNGICSCCGLQGLPIAVPVQQVVNIVLAGERAQSPKPARTSCRFIFRPPRIVVLS